MYKRSRNDDSEAKKALTLADAFQEARESALTSLNNRIMHCYRTAVSAKEMYFEMGVETPAARELMCALGVDLRAKKLEPNLKRFVEQNRPQIETAIKALEDLLPKRDFEWFFLPRERREAIRKAEASVLERIQNPDIVELQSFITSNRCTKILNAKEYWDSYLHNKSAYLAALTDHANNAGLQLGDQHKPTEQFSRSKMQSMIFNNAMVFVKHTRAIVSCQEKDKRSRAKCTNQATGRCFGKNIRR